MNGAAKTRPAIEPMRNLVGAEAPSPAQEASRARAPSQMAVTMQSTLYCEGLPPYGRSGRASEVPNALVAQGVLMHQVIPFVRPA